VLRSQLDTSLNAAKCYVEQREESKIERKLVWDWDFLVIPVVARANAQVCCRSLAGFAALNSAGGTDVNLLCLLQLEASATVRSLVQLCVCACVCVCVLSLSVITCNISYTYSELV
jgi:hypothetical protein